VPEAGIIVELDVVFDRDRHPQTGQDVITMGTYFVPEKKMKNGTFFDIEYPDEIILPNFVTYSNVTQAQLNES